ncbi:MAG: hypothetical protein IJ365_00085, partial [Clostridia bacterium]|nr:hypothetical protein [Clostridia bacterium]
SCINKKVYGSLWDYQKIVNSELEEKMSSVYSVYRGAKKIHDEWEQMYLDNIDFAMLEDYGSQIINKIAPAGDEAVEGHVYDRFFGAAMYNGNVNYIDNITDDLQKRYFIKGRPGTGKSTFLKKLAARLTSLGYECEAYHCGFDPGSLDMVVCRELSVCVFDATSPHEKFPVEQNDEILDFYVNSGLDGVDQRLGAKIFDVQLRYGKMMSLARLYLEEANAICAEADDRVKESIDFEELNNIVYEFLYEIF